MKVSKKIEATPEEFFKLLVTSIEADIKNADVELPAHGVKSGFSYNKRVSNRLVAKVTIEELTEPSTYSATFLNNRGTNHLKYDIEKIDDQFINVTVTEDFKGKKALDDINQNIMSFVLKRSGSKRTLAILSMMENYLKEQK